jgi:hypothetical protein
MKFAYFHSVLLVLILLSASIANAQYQLDSVLVLEEEGGFITDNELDNLYNYHDDADIDVELEKDPETETSDLLNLLDREIDDTVVYNHLLFINSSKYKAIYSNLRESFKLIPIYIFIPPDIS